MANAVEVPDCFFRWNIYDPFLPRRDLEATFYLGSPTVTQWKVTLQPMTRGIHYWEFSSSLEFDRRWEHRQEIVARRLMIQIFLNGIEITKNEVFNQYFHADNRFKYDFQTSAFTSPEARPHFLVVSIQISLVDRAARNEAEGAVFHRDDLICLSSDLNTLQNNPLYSNLRLIPRDSQVPTCAHSYIIKARWNNFFALHDFEADIRSEVETNISRAVLSDIVTYMYSGLVGISWPDWTNAAYTSELFRVIDRYKLYHLYKVFVKQDVQQLRVTRNSGIIESHLFPLHFLNGRQIANISYTWRVESVTGEYMLKFQFQVRNRISGLPWLSYSLLSESTPRVYVKVNMEVVKRVNLNPLEMLSILHEAEFSIEPNASVQSGCVLFLGSPETFGHPGGTETRHFIRCFLNVTDGTAIERIRSVDDQTLLNELARFEILSDHMLRLRRQPVDSDLRIGCHVGGRYGGGRYSVDYIHKGIFAIRVSDWWEALVNVSPANDFPSTAITTLSIDYLAIVHDYMYTGKLFDLPYPFLREIEEFAQRTRFSSLLDSVRRIRSIL